MSSPVSMTMFAILAVFLLLLYPGFIQADGKGKSVGQPRRGVFPSLCIFLTKTDLEIVGSGTIIAGRWAISVADSFASVEPEQIFMAAGFGLRKQNLTNHKSKLRQNVQEFRRDIAGLNHLILIKMEAKIDFGVDVGPGFVNAAVVKNQQYSCKLPIWSYKKSYDLKQHGIVEQDLYKVAITGIAIYLFAVKIEECVKLDKKVYVCLDFGTDYKLSAVHFGAPVYCGVGIEGIFMGVGGKDKSKASKYFAAMKIKNNLAIRQIVSEPSEQIDKVKFCQDQN